jgi:hypothetical protein
MRYPLIGALALLCWASPAHADDHGLLLVLLCPANTTADTCTPDNARDSMGFAISPPEACPVVLQRLQIDAARLSTELEPGEWWGFKCLLPGQKS